MSNTHYNVAVTYCMIVVFLAITCFPSYRQVEGRGFARHSDLHVKNKTNVKTIESEDGDVIDCFDIHEQPAFEHPLIKNIQLIPSSYSSKMKPKNTLGELKQLWQRGGKCPEGTIPIRRSPKGDYHRAFPSTTSPSRENLNQMAQSSNNLEHKYATAHVVNSDKFYGGHASINLWNPKPEVNEFSLSQIWLVSETTQGVNTMEAGWIVYPQRYRDSRTRFFIYWTSDGYGTTGCYDLDCAGFVQTDQQFAIGSAFDQVSSLNGNSIDLDITIFMDKESGNWWLQVQGHSIGYWPASLFTGFTEGALSFEFGGEITNGRNEGHFTTTDMGSGHFPSEGSGIASYFRDVKFVDNTNTLRSVEGMIQPYVVTNSGCYDIQIQGENNNDKGINFYYGGTGYSENCP